MKEILKAILNSETIARNTVDFYLNSMDCSESDYLAIYNHFANVTGEQKLTSNDDIYTEKNNQSELITYIINSNDEFYNDIRNLLK